MADVSSGNVGTVQPVLTDKIIYYYKLDTWPKDHVANMLGLQGATSGTNTRTVTSTALKQTTIKTMGSNTSQRTVAAYFQKNDGIYEDMEKAQRFGITVHLYRVDLNTVSGASPARTAEVEYSQCLLGALPPQEALAGIFNASLAFEVQGQPVKGTLAESEFEEGAFDLGEALYGFIAPTSAGGATDSTYTNANAAKPTREEGDDKYMKPELNSSVLNFGTGSSADTSPASTAASSAQSSAASNVASS